MAKLSSNAILLGALIVVCQIQLSSEQPAQSYDYIIVGSGPSGAVIANRLSENKDVSVLLLEAGDVPLGYAAVPYNFGTMFYSSMDWNIPLEKQKNCCTSMGASFTMPQAKVLGGGSSVNALLYIRGNHLDYDNWKTLLNDDTWGYDALLKYFKKLEDYHIATSVYDAPYHSKGGPIKVSWPSYRTPLANSFLDAAEELGYPLTDYNAEHQYGFSFPPANIKEGSRCGVYQAYLEPAKNRSNLTILPKALVTKIQINATTKTATGVLYEKGGKQFEAYANKEVILSAGAIQSPKLLMLSGIGPKATLDQYKIPVIQDAPGVGQGLKDHPCFVHSLVQFPVYPVPLLLSQYNNTIFQAIWNVQKTGPLTSVGRIEGLAFINSSATTSDQPDIEFIFFSDNGLKTIALALKPEYLEASILNPNIATFGITIPHPKSTGYVSIRSNNAHDNPIIDPNYFSDVADVKAIVEGMKIAEKMIKSEPFQRFGATLLPYSTKGCENMDTTSDKFYECVVRNFIFSLMHPASTCRMTKDGDSMGVVDTKLKVRGVNNLRVADASIIPEIPRAHLHIPCIMIGEKASDLIKADLK